MQVTSLAAKSGNEIQNNSDVNKELTFKAKDQDKD